MVRSALVLLALLYGYPDDLIPQFDQLRPALPSEPHALAAAVRRVARRGERRAPLRLGVAPATPQPVRAYRRAATNACVVARLRNAERSLTHQ